MAECKGFFIAILALAQIVSGHVEVDFIENVIKNEEASPSGSRIVSGWEARPGQHPHQISLRMVNAIGGVSACGGSIVHESWAISAAHCTAGQVTLVVRAGVTNLTTPAYISESTLWFNHPTFNEHTPLVVQPNDIAILRLDVPVTWCELLQPIRIQPSSEAFRNYAELQVYASGYGRTWTLGTTPEVLNWVYLRGVSNDDCFRTFGSIINNNAICARYYNVTSQSICQGDSGGPLVHVGSDGVPTLVGISSFVAGGDFGCHSGIPGGFIRPGPFLSWLREVTGIDFESLRPPTSPPPETTTTEEPTTTTTTTEQPTTVELPTTTTQPPVTTPEPEEEDNGSDESNSGSEESNNGSDESNSGSDESSSSEEEDPELADLLKRLEVKVKVKVRMNNYKKRHVVHKKH